MSLRCPHDGGTCHHECGRSGCFRLRVGASLTTPWPGYPKQRLEPRLDCANLALATGPSSQAALAALAGTDGHLLGRLYLLGPGRWPQAFLGSMSDRSAWVRVTLHPALATHGETEAL